MLFSTRLDVTCFTMLTNQTRLTKTVIAIDVINTHAIVMARNILTIIKVCNIENLITSAKNGVSMLGISFWLVLFNFLEKHVLQLKR